MKNNDLWEQLNVYLDGVDIVKNQCVSAQGEIARDIIVLKNEWTLHGNINFDQSSIIMGNYIWEILSEYPYFTKSEMNDIRDEIDKLMDEHNNDSLVYDKVAAYILCFINGYTTTIPHNYDPELKK